MKFEFPARSVGRLGAMVIGGALAACGTPMDVKLTPLTEQEYPAGDPGNVQVYDRRPPGEWEQIVRIDTRGVGDDDFSAPRSRARQEAAKLGAEAIEIHEERMESSRQFVGPTRSKTTNTWRAFGKKYEQTIVTSESGHEVVYSIRVGSYVGIRRGNGSGTDASSAPSFSCPKCSTQWRFPSKEGLYQCTCKQEFYEVSCVHCRKRMICFGVGDTTCGDCRQPMAVVLCKHCSHVQSDVQYADSHSCGLCGLSWYSAICPSCNTPFAWDQYCEKDTCPKCKKEFDLPKPSQERAPAQGYLGLTLADLPAEDCRRLMVPVGEAVVATEILEGSPAEKCGLRVGDVIVRIRDEAGNRWGGERGTYLAWIQSRRPGTNLTITLLRNDRKSEVKAILEQR